MKRKVHSRKRNTPQKNIFVTVVSVIVILLAVYGGFHLVKNVISQFVHPTEAPKVTKTYLTPPVKFNGRYKTTFDDIQEVQIESAMSQGITPMQTAADLTALIADGSVVDVGADSCYDCQADFPFLVPIAADLLEEVRKRYQDAAGDSKQLRLTSCLRTVQSVKGLKRWNPNSVENSCHLYGTTFDLSYSKMTSEERKILGQILYELQQGGYCYVKYELKQPCFHVTVRKGADVVEVDE